MISTEKLSLQFGSRVLFENVDIKFTPGNCYGLIGANGAGKSTFLRCLAGEQEPTSGKVVIGKGQRLSMLRQNHFAYDDVKTLTAVLMGHERLYKVMEEKDALYAKPDFSDADGARTAELEAEFSELNGWNAESEAAALLGALQIPTARHDKLVKDLDDSEKVRVLLAQALFGEPDILLLDEPTNHLDVDSILWLENFLYDFKNTVIVVSHDRHFLDKVCSHVADVDFQKVTLFSGNYTFWYESSQLALRQRYDANKKKEDKIKELKAFVQRFSANASKSRQASSRKSQLEKITLEDIKPSSRKYPYVVFETERELGREVLFVEGLKKTLDGVVLFENLSFSMSRGEKIALSGSDNATSALMAILSGEMKPDAGEVRWGRTANLGYLPKEYDQYFTASGVGGQPNLIEWMRNFSENKDENFVRSFLGRMLFSGEESKKSPSVLSGGEKVRCMLARLMLADPNVLLLDGPTNHLDLESITALNNGLLKFPGSVIVSSHDVQFVDSLITRVLELGHDPEGKPKFFDLYMGYEQYLADEARLARMGIVKA
jgi:ATPase subunit of ABC transporter with duplicated ATPase domains